MGESQVVNTQLYLLSRQLKAHGSKLCLPLVSAESILEELEMTCRNSVELRSVSICYATVKYLKKECPTTRSYRLGIV